MAKMQGIKEDIKQAIKENNPARLKYNLSLLNGETAVRYVLESLYYDEDFYPLTAIAIKDVIDMLAF